MNTAFLDNINKMIEANNKFGTYLIAENTRFAKAMLKHSVETQKTVLAVKDAEGVQNFVTSVAERTQRAAEEMTASAEKTAAKAKEIYFPA